MQKNKIIIAILVLIILIIGVIIIVKNDGKKLNRKDLNIINSNRNINKTIEIPNTSTSTKVYSILEINKHADVKSCWSTVSGKVYDLTNWISKHPGGDKAILLICGKDGSELFNKKHGGKEGPEKALNNFLIGNLEKIELI